MIAKSNDVYDMMLIKPILRSKTLQQVRAQARASRKKMERHEKASRMSVGDASEIYSRINAAELDAITQIIRDEQTYGKKKR